MQKTKNIKLFFTGVFIIFTLFFSTGYIFAQTEPEVASLENPIGSGTDINVILGNAVKVAMGVVGSLALIAFVYGGFMWLTSSGSQDKVKQGSNTMLYAVIGLFIIFAGYAILNTVLSGITGAGSKSPGTEAKCASVGTGFSCSNIDSCAITVPEGVTSTTIKRGICEKSPELCRVDLCPGDNKIVCCKTK
jgi:hypothetical protein